MTEGRTGSRPGPGEDGPRGIRVFISSPGDVAEERTLANRVLRRLGGEMAGRLELEPVFWEHEPLLATEGFQDQIPRPSRTDIAVIILWSRLGTRLPSHFRRPDGSRYESGTEFEFEDAVRGYRERGRPRLLVYRKTAEPLVSLREKSALLEKLEQQEALDRFIDRWFRDETEGTFTGAFHTFEGPDEFEELLETHLRKLLDKVAPRRPAAEPEAATERWTGGSPYRGLRAFDFEHAPVFFGRTRAVADILAALRRQAADGRPFVLVVGASGGGKSSVARAGVLPLLTQPGVVEGVGLWRRAVLRPTDAGGDLIEALTAALLRPEGLPELERALADEGPEAATLADRLRSAPETLPALLRRALGRAAEGVARRRELREVPEARLALLVDQMEELFTEGRAAPEERRAFVRALRVLIESGLVWTLATLRSDLYPRCVELPDLVALKEGAGQYDLLPPTPSEIGQMIRHPTLAAGLSLEEDGATGIRLEDLLRDAAAAQPGALPLLQFTLEELYRRRTPDGVLTLDVYRELGGVEGALANRAEEVFAGLPHDVRAAFPTVMGTLVSIDREDTVSARRWPRELVARTPEAAALVDAFVDARLFVADLADDGRAVVRVAHEALLRHWPRLADWIEEEKETFRERDRVASATRRWDSEGRPEDLLLPEGKPLAGAEELLERDSVSLLGREEAFIRTSVARRRRRGRIRTAAVAALAVLFLLAAVAAWTADRERRRAEVEATTANRAIEFLGAVFQQADPDVARGEEVGARELLDRAAWGIRSSLEGRPRIQARLMNLMARVYEGLDRIDRAEELVREALTVQRRELGEEHPDLATSFHNLGSLHHARADLEGAEESYRRALELFRRSDDRAGRAATLNGLASVLYERGAYGEAQEMYEEALRLTTDELGDDHFQTAGVASNLASLHRARGDRVRAEALYRKALEIQRRYYGGDAVAVAVGLGNLGNFLAGSGRYAEADSLLRASVAMHRRLLGDEDPRVGRALNNLAGLRHLQGDPAGADTLYRRALAVLERTLGAGHPEVAHTVNNLGRLRHDVGELPAADSLLSRSLDILRTAYGNEQPDVATALHNLGMLRSERGDLASADTLLAEAVRQRRKFAVPALHLADGLHALAGVRIRRGDPVGARPLLEEAAGIRREELGAAAAPTINVTWDLGQVRYATGDLEGSAESFARVVEGQRAVGADPEELALSLAVRGRVLAEADRCEEALPVLEEAREIRGRVLPDGSWEIAAVESALGGCLTERGLYRRAEALLLDSHPVLERALGREDELTRDSRRRLVELYESWGRPEEADRYRSAGAKAPPEPEGRSAPTAAPEDPGPGRSARLGGGAW